MIDTDLLKTATAVTALTFALMFATTPAAHAAADCAKDWDAVAKGMTVIDRTLAGEAGDTLVGWDKDDDGNISKEEYMDVCTNRPEDYKSIENMDYFKKQKLRGQ